MPAFHQGLPNQTDHLELSVGLKALATLFNLALNADRSQRGTTPHNEGGQ
jgi:hypothetical protein